MKIINQSYEIISLPDNPLYLIEKAARTCYKSEDKIGCTVNYNDRICFEVILGRDYDKCYNTNCEAHSSHKFLKMLIKNGHEAVLEFSEITVRLITNRSVTHELVRHRVGMSYMQESTRYVKYDGNMEFIRPVWWEKSNNYEKTNWEQAIEMAEMYYLNLLNSGWRAEKAREVLPNSLKTEIMIKGNIRSFRHLFKLRTSKKAHPQIRSLMTSLLNDLKKRIPVVFDDIGGGTC